MRKNLMNAAIAAVSVMSVLIGCQKEVASVQDNPEKARLEISVPMAKTKVTSEANEMAINNYQVFLFNDKGVLENYVNQQSSAISMECTLGSKTVAVIVNAPAIRDITTMAELKGKVSYLSDNTLESFVMEGMVPVEIESTTSVSVEVPVSRKVARIELLCLDVVFELPQYRQQSFKVSSVYLINVPASMPYFANDVSSLWLNKSGYVESDTHPFIYDDMNDVLVTMPKPYTTRNVFYCYANNAPEDSFSPMWSPRNTRLVVEALLGEQKYYYPVTLPALEANKKYDVTLSITRPGVESPDAMVDKYTSVFSIVAQDWDEGDAIYTEI